MNERFSALCQINKFFGIDVAAGEHEADLFAGLDLEAAADESRNADRRRRLDNDLCLVDDVIKCLGNCVFAIVILSHHKVKASVILGMLISCIVYWGGSFIFLDTNPFESLATASFVPPLGDMLDTTFFKFDFKTFISIGWFTAVALIITFCMIDMFDTIGTLVGTAARANMLDKDGKMPKMKEALLADAVGTVAGACTGTSTVTTFIESGSGVEAGGRTGLTALTTAVMFLLCMFIAPIAALIPAPATSAALIYVGILMLSGLKNVDWDDILQVIPVALMLIFMPITGSIGHGIGMALISYSVVAAFTGKAKEVSILTYVLSALFLAKFFIIV